MAIIRLELQLQFTERSLPSYRDPGPLVSRILPFLSRVWPRTLVAHCPSLSAAILSSCLAIHSCLLFLSLAPFPGPAW